MTARQGVQQLAQGGVEWWQHTMSRMVRCRTVPALLDLAYDAIRGGLGFDSVGVLLVDPARGGLVERITTDETGQKVYPPDHLLLDHPYVRLLDDERLHADGPGFLYDADGDQDGDQAMEQPPRDEHVRTLYVALRTPLQVLGLLVVANVPGRPPVTPADAPPLVALATAFAAALESTVLRDDPSRSGAPADVEPHRHAVEQEALHGRAQDEQLQPWRDQERVAAGPDEDSITGLLTHRALLEHLDRTVAAALPFTLLLVDVDNFTLFNATHGYTAGDQVLRRVAMVLRHVCQAEDVAARYGDDELAVVLRGVTGKGARTVLRRVESMVRTHPYVAPDGTTIPLSISSGLACYPADGRSVQQLVSGAEEALSAAKRGRRALPRLPYTTLLGKGHAGTLYGLVTAVDCKDRYTREHSEDVTRWALLLAEAVGLSAEQRRVLALAGPLHDVGKIAVPDRILRKPGKLTREEYETMKHHVSFGVAIIQGVLHDATLVDAVMHHHERWDGHGYPHGRTGMQVPLLGRIMQIADAVSAMRLNRLYRQAIPWERVVAELRAGAGTQFDPDLIAPFIAAIGRLRT